MIGHQARLRENDVLPLWRVPSFFNVRAQVTGEIIRIKDAQCNTTE